MTQAITSAPAHIQALPPEIFQDLIIKESRVLDFTDICRLQMVCRSFNECLQQDFIWKPFLLRDFPLQGCQEKVQQAYRRSHLLRSNVINGVFQESKFGKHQLNFRPALSVASDKLFCWGNGGFIKIWDLKTKQVHPSSLELMRNSLEQNVGDVTTGDGQILFLGFLDGIIQVYDLKIEKFVLFSDVCASVDYNPIHSLAYYKGKLFVALHDGTIKVLSWSVEKYELKEIKEFKALHPQSLSRLAVSGRTLVSLDTSGNVRFWDLLTYECRHTFDYPNFTDFFLSDRRFIIGLASGWVDIISIEDGTVLHSLEAHTKAVMSLFAFEGILFSEDHGERKIWDLATGKPIGTMFRGLTHPVHYAYSEGTLFYRDNHHEIGAANYLADDDEIFADIAGLFRANQEELRNLLERFNRMPKYAREQIYREFAPFHHNPEEFFNDRTQPTHKRRVKAIDDYLAERRKKEVKK